MIEQAQEGEKKRESTAEQEKEAQRKRESLEEEGECAVSG